MEKGPQILLGPVPSGLGSIDSIQVGHQQQVLHEFRQGASPCLFPQLFQLLPEGNRLCIITCQHGVVNGAVLFSASDPCQVIGGEAEGWACQGAEKGNILPGVGNGLQNRPQGSHLRGFQQILPGPRGAAYARLFQRLPEGRSQGAWGPEQDHNVLRCDGAQPFFGPHKRSTVQHFSDASGHKGCLLPVGILLGLQRVKFHSGIG